MDKNCRKKAENLVNCPICGQEMERGAVVTQNSEGLFFLPPGETLGLLLNTRKGIEKRGGIVLDGPYFGRFSETEVAACICRSCRKILMDF